MILKKSYLQPLLPQTQNNTSFDGHSEIEQNISINLPQTQRNTHQNTPIKGFNKNDQVLTPYKDRKNQFNTRKISMDYPMNNISRNKENNQIFNSGEFKPVYISYEDIVDVEGSGYKHDQ